jgi:hypothetical protein
MQEPVTAAPSGTGVGFGRGFDEVVKPRYKTPAGWDTSKGEGAARLLPL